MKILIATGGLLILAGAFVVRSQSVPVAERPVTVPQAVPQTVEPVVDPPVAEPRMDVPVLVPVVVEAPVEVKKTVEGEVGTGEPVERVVPLAVSQPQVPRWSLLPSHQDRILFLFDRQVDLSKDQRRHFADVFLSRDAEIKAYQAQITRSGIFNVPEYRVKIREMIAESYDRMAHALDSQQQQLFYSIVAAGRLGDAVEFEMDPGLVVLH